MKIKSILFLLLILSFASCEIDNYEAPQLTLSGKFVDSETGELVESGGINEGTIIKLYENDSNQPLIFNTLPDGTFTNSRVFAGSYSYTAEGPFELAVDGPQSLVIKEDVEIEVPVIPNVRLSATVEESNGTTAKINLKYEKVANEQKLVELGVVWSEFRSPNVYVFPEGGIKLENVASLNLSSGEKTFLIEELKPDTKYYIRVTAKTDNAGNYYNYSKQIELDN